MRSTRRLAANIDPDFDIEQPAFAALVDAGVSGPSELVRAELAPGFVTRLVHPITGNESFIGKSPVSGPNGEEPALAREVKRGFPVLKRIDVGPSGVGEIEVHAEVRKALDQEIVSVGMISIVVAFELKAVVQAPNLGEGNMEFLILSQPAGAPSPEIPEAWQATGNLAPFQQVMRYPPGDFLLFLRPLDGWRPMPADLMQYRLQMAGLTLLLLFPAVLANWFALSRALTRNSLTQAQLQMRGLLRNIPGAALTVRMPAGSTSPSVADKLTFLNPDACKEIWEVDAEVLEKDAMAFWRSMASADAVNDVKAAVGRSVQTMKPVDEIWPIKTPSGTEKWLFGRGNPARQDDGSTIWSTLIFDHTKQVEHQKELELQRELAFRAQKNESIGHLTGGMAHDFNNLLAVVLGNLELLAEDETDPERREILDAAIQATFRGARLTRSMLAFAGRARLTPETLKLNEVVEEAQTWIKRTLPKTITVQLSLAEDLAPVFLDRSSVESALLNMILNARDAMQDRGTLTIKTSNVTIDNSVVNAEHLEIDDGAYVLLAVSDTGHGIGSDKLDDIFEPFFTTKGPGQGSGLGLSMVMGFAKQSGGTVTVDTEVGKGATFNLFFPVASAAAPDQAGGTDLEAKHADGPLRILLAEDEEQVLEVLKQTLKRAGHTIVAANSGDVAHAILKSDTAFDLMITDMVMPGDLQGDDLAHAAREIVPGLPVIFISGYADEKTQTPGSSTESSELRLTKPVRRDDLLSAVNHAVHRMASADA